MADIMEETAEARERLHAERAKVLQELEQLDGRLETKGDYELGEGDPMIYQWELNLALRERAQQHLAEIDEALAQLSSAASPSNQNASQCWAIRPCVANALSVGVDSLVLKCSSNARREAGRLCLRHSVRLEPSNGRPNPGRDRHPDARAHRL
jgi:hypothetical protein